MSHSLLVDFHGSQASGLKSLIPDQGLGFRALNPKTFNCSRVGRMPEKFPPDGPNIGFTDKSISRVT